jgi:hypothetical protein
MAAGVGARLHHLAALHDDDAVLRLDGGEAVRCQHHRTRPTAADNRSRDTASPGAARWWWRPAAGCAGHGTGTWPAGATVVGVVVGGGGWGWSGLTCESGLTIVMTHPRSATWPARGYHHSPCDGDALLLAARQRGASLSVDRLTVIRQGTDELVRVGQPGSPPPPTARMPTGVASAAAACPHRRCCCRSPRRPPHPAWRRRFQAALLTPRGGGGAPYQLRNTVASPGGSASRPTPPR